MPNISLVTYAGQTVTPLDDALVYETAINQSGMIYGGTVTIKNANNLHISSGHGMVCGRKFTIFESDIQVALSSSGTLLGRLYVQLDLSNVGTPVQLLVETGASLTPVVQERNVNIMNGVYEFNLATFTVDTSTISNIVNVAPSAEPSTGAGSVITVTTSEASLQGKMCTITDGTTTLNANFDNTGTAIFYGVQMVGTVIVNATDGTYYASGQITITFFGKYSTSIAFWGATVNLSTTTPEFYGQTISITQDGIAVGTTSFDGSGSATYTAPAVGTYVFTVTYGGNDYSATVNVTEETTYTATIDTTPAPQTYNLTVTIYSAASDTLSYTDDNGAQTVTTDATGKATGVSITITQPSAGVDPTITFTSSVAKDPSNLSNNYTKSVTITQNMTEIDVMPASRGNMAYWYGFNNGMTTVSGSTGSISYNMNDITVVQSGAGGNAVKKTGLTGTKAYFIAQGITANGDYGICAGSNNGSSEQSTRITSTSVALYNVAGTFTEVKLEVNNSRSARLYAAWVE